MKIDGHISELLYRYDCVIVPELGGFVCNYAPAKIQPVQHSFSPPSKHIVFNSNLRNNDGLLANHISVEEKRTFAEANSIIKDFVSDANLKLESGKKVGIEEVGTLFMDVERNIQFEPDVNSNFLLESFGLNTFNSPAIKREGISQRIEKGFKDRIIPKEASVGKAPKRKINVRRMAALAIAAPLIAAMVWIPLKTDLLKKINFASINPFAKKETPLYKAPASIAPVLSAKELGGNAEVKLNENTVENVSIKLTDESAHSIVVNVAKPDSTAVRPVENNPVSVSRGNFFIIGGCFEVPENATRFAASLREKGYNAEILSEKLGRLSPVCYSSFGSREEALNELAKIHAADPNAWLLVK